MIHLSDLPAPPAGKVGWPWTVGGAALPKQRPDGGDWPTISVVTPSFNQGSYLEETIRSVLLQGYPLLEYVIIDGGSSDESADIIRRYAQWLTYWQSQPDGGQADAVNIGLAHCTGEMFNFINSDDTLLPGTLERVGGIDRRCLGLAGSVINRGANSEELFVHGPMTLADMLRRDHFHQPGIWLRRDAVVETGGFDASYNYCFDKKFYLKFLARHDHSIATTEAALAVFRLHETSKTTTSHASFRDETLRALNEVLPEISGSEERALANRSIERLKRENARDALLDWAEERLAGDAPSLSDRLAVVKRFWARDAAGVRAKLLEMVVFGSNRARQRSLSRKARRAGTRPED